MAPQVPVARPVSAFVQAWQVPEQAVLQQNWLPEGPMQLACRHWVLAVHDCPSGRRAQVVLPWQKPLVQSAAVPQPWEVRQVLPCASQVAPPQSTSVSSPFLTPSVHVGAWQVVPASVVLALQTPSTQSPATRQLLVSAHLPQVAPPQSTSVSSPSLTPSVQCAETQLPLPSQTTPPLSVQAVPVAALVVPQAWAVASQELILHTVVGVGQSVGARQATQLPLPSQSLPPLSVQATPLVASAVPQQSVVQVGVTHAVVGTGQTVAMVAVVHATPAPPHEGPASPLLVLLVVLLLAPPVLLLVVVIEPPVPLVVVLLAPLLVLLVVLLLAPPVPPLVVTEPPVPPPSAPGILLRSTAGLCAQPAAVTPSALAARTYAATTLVRLLMERTPEKWEDGTPGRAAMIHRRPHSCKQPARP